MKLADNAAEARAHAEAILGMDIKGLEVQKVLVTPAEDIASEAYVGCLVDRAAQSVTFMVSSEGGVDIEEVAHTNPDAIKKLIPLAEEADGGSPIWSSTSRSVLAGSVPL